MQKVLETYPFRRLPPPLVELVEGFKAYDGVLGDKPGDPHKGIDYVKKQNGVFVYFGVFSTHEGHAVQGFSKTWGKLVSLKKEIEGVVFYSVCSHLTDISTLIPVIPPLRRQKNKDEFLGRYIKTGEYLGISGTTGLTNGIIQLHFELHIKEEGKERVKIDPYGIYDVASSGKYPQPGQTLAGLEHYWTSDNPPFAE